ncbi:S41 family peptidase [Halosquirtibacter xylanolyticus]|uniref:S41 family peptidase n=1 Tax=Halosquirtibacter xylanolyticus TaxID=3374599 RepID=UPI003749E1BA|nr:S41 family peptidase [Prolixibacteraceae bacterium]
MNKLLLVFISVFMYSCSYAQTEDKSLRAQAVKYARVLSFLEEYYVDSVDLEQVTTSAIKKVLSDLDPHSSYVSAEEVEKMTEMLEGSFEGIGISFNISNDTLVVMSTISGGPSEQVGIHAGDKILMVDGENIAGVGLTNSKVVEVLRGSKGTKVVLMVKRGVQAPVDYTVVRDEIPIYSLDASYMADPNTAYIKLNRFGAKTEEEFTEALAELEKENDVQNLILDLRGNGGGYLRAAIGISNQYLNKNKLIVYTSGLHSPKKEYYSDSDGDFKQGKMIVLIDEGSASASEIVTGAIQDWDRGVVIGRRSFGKGLVQQPFMLTDGSLMRLTIAHYFTPAGRNIQKPYGKGTSAYYKDIMDRVEDGELFDSTKVVRDSTSVYYTLKNHRKFYGGGGVVPDIYVPLDSTVSYGYINQMIREDLFYPYVFEYLNKHREDIAANYPDFASYKSGYKLPVEVIENLHKRAKEKIKDVKVVENEESNAMISLQMRAIMARFLYPRGAFYEMLNEDDDEIDKALEILNSKDKYQNILNRDNAI